jgi:hypothetical protein
MRPTLGKEDADISSSSSRISDTSNTDELELPGLGFDISDAEEERIIRGKRSLSQVGERTQDAYLACSQGG